MAAGTNAPIIIKKKKIVGGDGHHGGAWKVAYADFVTAMMAFFMLMWLLNATTEQQRQGLADYFSPSIPISRISGGGDGALGGDSVFVEETLPQSGTGTAVPTDTASNRTDAEGGADGDGMSEEEAITMVEEVLNGSGGESYVMENALRHIMTRQTDEGLIVEIFDLPGEPLFHVGSNEPTNVMIEVTRIIAEVFDLVTNEVAIAGHTRSQPIVLQDNPVWNLSSDRADRTRRLLVTSGMESERMQRVTGYADRKPAAQNPLSIRNNRLEVILLRSDQ
ncbi:flagellar motor protein MotB [Cochlodiniinecator piscidefendens]|uniref:flagellar motor protein MotB n=1 Tax=Cochlodiniinecator piscidefendens TaxID=2715756 RepID=UPI001407FFB0|nr:flagellar motor protein MotB [Cochlodiniinecator piscidefendens]